MPNQLTTTLPLELVSDPEKLRSYLLQGKYQSFKIRKRSIDARKKDIKINLTVDLFLPGESDPEFPLEFTFVEKQVNNSEEVAIIGAGPAGLFAALRLIELGLKPIIFERGNDVRTRRRDLAAINKDQIVNPESNYCFGEGGAGTYSDGKLYTRSGKRGSVRRILERFFLHGADESILIEAHPHIGTNKLPKIITSIREKIIECGGEVRFNSKLTGIEYNSKGIQSIQINHNENIAISAIILATGHSARDVFHLLNDSNIAIEFKPFALGVRVEHPQTVIDSIQYHCDFRGDYLPPASYSWVEQINGRGVYSFCMCPGGIIAPCATSPGEIVTNGWSPSKRNNPFANSGIVVPVEESDLIKLGLTGPLAGVKYQAMVEQKAWLEGGKSQVAPAQRLVDFISGKTSKNLPACSYQPGIQSVDLKAVLPTEIHSRLKEAFIHIGKKMKGYLQEDAVLVAPESRTSSPVRIPRSKITLMHESCPGLFPCGEGAGYAGGIVSAAMDGENVADAVADFLNS
ncbi:MAG: FAD-binding protein [Bacteroidia bacterium]|nr:FAD-binding protein [Bacteroidia bacterium]